MMKPIVFLFLCLLAQAAAGQAVETIYRNPKDSSGNFYVIRPPKAGIKGLLVLNDRGLADSVKRKASELGIMTVTVVPSANPFDNLVGDSLPVRIDHMIRAVTARYHIAGNKVILGGMSLAGTGVIRYAQYCHAAKAATAIKPLAVFAVDAPLDYERLWHEAARAVQRNFHEDAVAEGKAVMKYLQEKLKGTPQTNIGAYRRHSPFCYSAPGGGNARLLSRVAVRLYTEPDVNWWITNRRKDYRDINAIDNAALVNQLKASGHAHAELILTHEKGFRDDGTRHPHSWSIVDETELLLWCDRLFTGGK
jgi:hypothetical protein